MIVRGTDVHNGKHQPAVEEQLLDAVEFSGEFSRGSPPWVSPAGEGKEINLKRISVFESFINQLISG